MLFKKTKKFQVFLIVVMIVIPLEEVVTHFFKSSKEDSSSLQEMLPIENQIPIPEFQITHTYLLENKSMQIPLEVLNYLAVNEYLYKLKPIEYVMHTMNIKLYICEVHRDLLTRENRILIKNLAENTITNSKYRIISSLQVLQKDFSYKKSFCNFTLPYHTSLDNKLTIFLSNYPTDSDSTNQKTDMFKEFIYYIIDSKSDLLDIIELPMFIMAYYFYKDFPKYKNTMDRAIIPVLAYINKSSEVQLDNIYWYMPLLEVDYITPAKEALFELEEIIKKENELIIEYSKTKEKEDIHKLIKTENIQLENMLITHFQRDLRTESNIICDKQEPHILFHIVKMIVYMLMFSNNPYMDKKDRANIENYVKLITIQLFEKAWNSKKFISRFTSNPEKNLSEVIVGIRDEVFECFCKIMKTLVEKGYIKYIEGIFEDKIRKIIEVFLYLEIKNHTEEIVKYSHSLKSTSVNILEQLNFSLSIWYMKNLLTTVISTDRIENVLKLLENIEKVIYENEDGKVGINEAEISIDLFLDIYNGYNFFINKVIASFEDLTHNCEIWDNPAFLHYNTSEHTQSPTLYVIYRNTLDKKIYKKEVENTIMNLMLFNEATKCSDIEKMEGKESKEISIEELFELEDRALEI